MKNNIKIICVIIMSTTAIFIFSVVIRNAIFYTPTNEINIPIAEQKYFIQKNQLLSNNQTLSADIFNLSPIQLLIPSIGVSAKVQNVGITRKGNMATPNNFTDVGWFKYGILPGETGSAIIAGHVDNGFAFPGVFKNLENIQLGDNVYLKSYNGNTTNFKVIKIETFDYNAPTENIFYQNNGKFLKLITCTGTWIPELRTHNKRLVVTTKLEQLN